MPITGSRFASEETRIVNTLIIVPVWPFGWLYSSCCLHIFPLHDKTTTNPISCFLTQFPRYAQHCLPLATCFHAFRLQVEIQEFKGMCKLGHDAFIGVIKICRFERMKHSLTCCYP